MIFQKLRRFIRNMASWKMRKMPTIGSMATAISLRSVSYTHLDVYKRQAWYWAHPPQYMPQNCNLDDVAHIRKFVDIPVVCAGRMTPEAAAEAIADGRIDAMGVARQFLVDGQWVRKLREGRTQDIQPCICCHNACFPLAHYKGVANRCV